MELGSGEGIRIFQCQIVTLNKTLLHIGMVKYKIKGGLVHTRLKNCLL